LTVGRNHVPGSEQPGPKGVEDAMPPPFRQINLAQFAQLFQQFNFTLTVNAAHFHHTPSPRHGDFRSHESVVPKITRVTAISETSRSTSPSKEYASCLKGQPAQPIFLACPAGFNFTFVYCYLIRFMGHRLLSYSVPALRPIHHAAHNFPIAKAPSATCRGVGSTNCHTHITY
jgi:hypothetical protein